MGVTTMNARKHGIKVLVLCTGNTCRSQMAHGLLESYGKDLAVYSAGVKAEPRVNPKAVLVMREMGIDISDHKPCLHIPFEDPSKVTEGSYEFRMNEYRRIRDEINDKFFKLYCDMEERK